MIRRRFGSDRERGVSVVEFAILMPVFLPLIFLLIQAGLYFHAQNVAQAVAQTTARVIRTYDGPVGGDPKTQLPGGDQLQANARRVAVETWQSLDANKTMSEPAADAVVQPGTNELVVTIRSNCINLLPGILPTLPVNARASGPIEIFKPQGTN